MLYCDYKFFIDEDGLKMADKHQDEMIKVESIPLQLGDIFVLTQTSDGCLYFRRTKQKRQLELF